MHAELKDTGVLEKVLEIYIFVKYFIFCIKNMTKMIELMEDNDDIQNVYHNWEQDEWDFFPIFSAKIAVNWGNL